MGFSTELRNAIREVDGLISGLSAGIARDLIAEFGETHIWDIAETGKIKDIVDRHLVEVYGPSKAGARRGKLFETIYRQVLFTGNRAYDDEWRRLFRDIRRVDQSRWQALRAAISDSDDEVSGVLASLRGRPSSKELRIRERMFDPQRRWVDGDGYRLSDRVWGSGRRQRKQIDKILQRGIRRGQSVSTIARQLDQYLNPAYSPVVYKRDGRIIRRSLTKNGGGAYSSRRLARTELVRVNALATEQYAKALEKRVPGVGQRYSLSPAHPKPDRCDQNAAGSDPGFPRGTYAVGNAPKIPDHPQCVIGSTVVSGPDPRVITKRWYEGDIIDIVDDAGHKVSVTPNHPVLTDKGWVPAYLVDRGDNLVCDEAWIIDDALHGVPHYQGEVPSIENISESVSRSSCVTAISVPSSPEQFHGDGANGDVDIVFTDSQLRGALDSSGFENAYDLLFRRGGALPASLSGLGLLEEEVFASSFAPDGVMSGGSHSHPLLRGHTGEGDLLGLGSSTDSHPRVPDYGGNDGAGYFGVDGDALEGFPAFVSGDDGLTIGFSKVLSATRSLFAGHVYNLDTGEGWYIANGIVVHNCMCSYSIYTPPSDQVLRYLEEYYRV